MSDISDLQPGKQSVSAGQPQSNIDRYIEREEDLQRYIDTLRRRGVREVALDLEGDQGTIRYNYSVSIFQCHDGQEMVIVDVLRMGINETLRAFLNEPAITKIMFSCANDAFITQNVLRCTIAPVRDIAVGQKLLNEPTTLSGYLNIDAKTKDSFQRANWLKRPISQELLEYATNDVAHLLSIEHTIRIRLIKEHLFDRYCEESMNLVQKNYRIDQMHHYKAKFPGYPRLSPSRKRAAAVVWVVREMIGKQFDCPVGYILSKKAMASIIKRPEPLPQQLERELNIHRSKIKKIPMEQIEQFCLKAIAFLEKSGVLG